MSAIPYTYSDGGRSAAGFKGSAGDCVARVASHNPAHAPAANALEAALNWHTEQTRDVLRAAATEIERLRAEILNIAVEGWSEGAKVRHLHFNERAEACDAYLATVRARLATLEAELRETRLS